MSHSPLVDAGVSTEIAAGDIEPTEAKKRSRKLSEPERARIHHARRAGGI